MDTSWKRPARLARGKTPARRLLRFDRLEDKILLASTGLVTPIPASTAHVIPPAPGGAGISNPAGSSPGFPSATANGLTPTQVGQAYGFTNISFNADPKNLNPGTAGDGTGQTIAIVVAYIQPNIKTDLSAFDQQFNLPDPPSFNVLAEAGATNAPRGNWGIEASLDVEWAHALAPGANILLVEAASASNSDLYGRAAFAATQSGVSVVLMGFGTAEFAGETAFDPKFTTPAGHRGVVFVAAAGDVAGTVDYPAASPNVLAVGGSSLTTDAQGDYQGESAWSSGGGGLSQYETQPVYQKGVVTQSTSQRATPDVSFNAGYRGAVYDSYDFGAGTPWNTIGGTSLATAGWAALIAIADQGSLLRPMTQGTIDGPVARARLYKMQGSEFYHDIQAGSNGYPATPGFDLATGLGSPIAGSVAATLTGNLNTPAPVTIPMSLTTTTPTFEWSSVAGAASYLVTIVNSTGKVILQTTVYETSFTPTSPLPTGNNLTWRVQAVNLFGETSNFDPNPVFNPTSLLATPVINGFNGATTPLTPTLSWAAVPNAASYHLILKDQTSSTQALFGTTGTFVTITAPLNNGDRYQWSVYALDSVGDSGTSQAAPDTFVAAIRRPVQAPGVPDEFDEQYYLAANPDVAAAVKAGIFTSGYQHFVAAGQFEGRNPSPYFNEAYYLATYPDVAAAVRAGAFTSGFFHFIEFGQQEGRNPSPYFNNSFYLSTYPDVAAVVRSGSMASGFEHFVLYGQYEGRSPTPVYSESYYLSTNPDVAAAVTAGAFESGYEHFVLHGQEEGRNPSALFNSAYYLSAYPDVASVVSSGALVSGYEHFVEFGLFEGRISTPNWNEANYLADNPDVALAVARKQIASGFEQYVLYGQFEGRVGGLA